MALKCVAVFLSNFSVGFNEIHYFSAEIVCRNIRYSLRYFSKYSIVIVFSSNPALGFNLIHLLFFNHNHIS